MTRLSVQKLKAFAERVPQSDELAGVIQELRGESKYGNHVSWHNGRRFDSDAEYERWCQLELLEQAGEISLLTHHTRYTLRDAFTDADGRRHRAIVYECDAAYVERGWAVVEDTKGYWTALYRLKAKLMRERYPNVILRVVQV